MSPWWRRLWYVDFVTNSALRAGLRALPALPEGERMSTRAPETRSNGAKPRTRTYKIGPYTVRIRPVNGIVLP